jgi:uroporphyrinogen-III synthase
MLNPKIHIASCRKIKAANKQNALQHGIEIDDIDLLQIDYATKIELPKQNSDAVVFTSQHSLKAIAALKLETKKCFCIEGETSKLALENGFNVIATASTSKLLAQEILKYDIKSILFFCGDEHLEEWIFDLEEKNISVEKCVVYFKKLVPHQFENIDGAMFFSPSQVESFLIKNELKTPMPVFSIGETTAAFLHLKGFQNIIIAKLKTEESVIESVINYFRK